MSAQQLRRFGARHGREDSDQIARDLAGISDKPKDPNWLSPREAAAVLGISESQINRVSIYTALRDVAGFKRTASSVFYALLDMERIGAIKRHNNVSILEACRMFCEENE